MNSFSRRDFLKLAGLGSMMLGLYSTYPEFFRKVMRSIQEGSVIEDVGEILQSRFPDEESQISLTLRETHSDISESWMPIVSEKFDIFNIPEIDTNVGFFHITRSCKILELPLHQIKNATSTFDKSNHDIEFYDLSFALKDTNLLTLPLPPYENHQNLPNLSNQYLLFAAFRRRDGSIDVSATVRPTRSSKRGGLLLSNQSELLVTTPEEFNLALDNGFGSNINAAVEYPYILDSSELNHDLDNLIGRSGKDLLYVNSCTNCIVTFYDRYGTAHTTTISTFSPYNETTNTFGPSGKSINIHQMTGLVQQYAQNNHYARFVLAIPDMGNEGGLITPIHFSRKDISQSSSLPKEYLFEEVLSNAEMYRTLDVEGRNFAYPSRPFKYILASGK